MFLVDTSTELVNTCNNCESKDFTNNTRYEKFLDLPEIYGVVSCRNCQLSWMSPRPTASSFRELYRFDNYFSGENVSQSYSEISRSRLYMFERKIQKVIGDKQAGLNVLDIGAATGEFLNIAKRMGHEVYGVELSSDARSVAKKNYGIELVEGIDQLSKNIKFDLIHLNHVLEHVPDPKSMLVNLSSMISNDGLILLEVPQQFDNDLDRVRRLFSPSQRKRFNAYSLHHTYFFDCNTLRLICEQAGLNVISLKTALPERTPLSLLSFKNLALRGFLYMSDKIHKGGNVIEVLLNRR